MTRYHINPDSNIPVYRQLTDQINAEIRSGVLPTGEKLPTVREMADQMHLSCGTVKRVYDRLQEMGDIEMTRRKGTYVKFVREEGDSRKIRAMAAIDRMLRQLSDMNFSMKEIQIFLNLKLRELGLKQSGVRITVVANTPETEETFSRQLNTIGNVSVHLCLLQQLQEYPYSVDEQADVILAAAEDCPAVEALLPDREKLIPVAMAPDKDFLLRAAACKGEKIGVLFQNPAYFALVENQFPEDLPMSLCGIDINEDETALFQIRKCDALIVPEGYRQRCGSGLCAEIESYRAKGRVILFRYGVDEGSMLYLNDRISRIRDERRLRPGGIEY